MKAQILKISGHKNEKDFYKEFPTMESFMAKHGAAFKKAQSGLSTDSNKNGIPDYLEINSNQYTGMGNVPQMFGSGLANPNFGPHNNPNPISVSPNLFRPTSPESDDGYDLSGITPKPLTPKELGIQSRDIGLETTGAPPMTPGKAPSSFDMNDAITGGLGMVGNVVDAIKGIKAEKKALKTARTWRDVSGVARKASETQDVNTRSTIADTAKRTRKALMPDVDVNNLFPSYGVGTNVLAKHGGEIMNTYDPGTLYDDLGYEPLSDSDIVKAYRSGGLIPHAQWGIGLNTFGQTLAGGGAGGAQGPWGSISNVSSGIMNAIGGPNAGADLGGALGELGGSFLGPFGAVGGRFLGETAGRIFDRNPQKTERANRETIGNVQAMANMDNLVDFRNSNRGVFEDGGFVDANPMVVKYFGNNSVKSLLKPDPMMDTLRTGGNIRQNNVGDIQALSGGHLEPISYNPYSDGEGITSMIKGQTHEESNGRHTGVLLNYNKAEDGASLEPDVEAENNEPITEIGDSAVIFGDMVINEKTVGNDPMFKNFYGKTFKKAMHGIAEQNQKLNKQQSKNTKALNDLDVRTPIDKLTLNSFSMNEKGIDTRYAANDAVMKKAAAHQEVIHSVTEPLGINSGDYSRGKLTTNELSTAENGTIMKAQNSAKITKTKAMESYPKGQKKGPVYYGNVTDKDVAELQKENPWFDWKSFDPKRKGDVLRFQNKFNELAEQVGSKSRLNPDDQLGEQTVSARIETDEPGAVVTKPAKTTPNTTPIASTTKNENYEVDPYQQYGWENIIPQVLPWLRRQPGEDLQADQLSGEMFALSNNQEEPVQARYYHPNLRTPYDVSYQDQLNENQADFNQLVRAQGNNPEALAALAAQKYGANSKVLAEQFRANQAMKENVYSGNIQTLNDALARNLQIADQQYVRQATAKSATKAVKQEALNSISSKIAQNRLENRTLQTYANMFPDFSYDKSFRLRKTGAPTTFNMPVIYNATGEVTHVAVYDDNGKVIDYKAVNPTERPASATPGIVADKTKKERNGGIVRAFKNL